MKSLQLCRRRQIAKSCKYCFVHVIVFLWHVFSLFLFLIGWEFRVNSLHNGIETQFLISLLIEHKWRLCSCPCQGCLHEMYWYGWKIRLRISLSNQHIKLHNAWGSSQELNIRVWWLTKPYGEGYGDWMYPLKWGCLYGEHVLISYLIETICIVEESILIHSVNYACNKYTMLLIYFGNIPLQETFGPFAEGNLKNVPIMLKIFSVFSVGC